MLRRERWHKHIKGFTLIELLVVMAITVILMGLIFGPLMQGFNLTNQARVQVQTQDTARRLIETVQRDLSNGVFVFDNTPVPGANPSAPNPHSIVIWIRDASGAIVPKPLDYGYIDFVPPARSNDQNLGIPGGLVDPTTGLYMNQQRGPLALPVAPGRIIVRYWLGLRDNTSNGSVAVKPYANFYDDVRNLSQQDHNPVILYRAMVSPYNPDGTVNTSLFAMDASGAPILYDPNFFYDSTMVPPVPELDANTQSVPRWQNWRAVARAMVPTDKADEVVCLRGQNNRPDYTTMSPLVRFQPTYVGDDAGSPSSSTDAANEMPAIAASSDVAAYGHWTYPFRVRVIRNDGSYHTYDPTVSSDILTQTGGDTGFNPLSPSPVAGTSTTLMFTADSRRGLINFAFPTTVLPGTPPVWVWDTTEIGNMNSAYAAFNPSNGGTPIRYISLAKPANNAVSPLTQIPNCRIVPGSEVVKGPDMRPGPNYGREVTYTRIPRQNAVNTIGPNEYMINYVNEPGAPSNPQTMQDYLLAAGTIIFDSKPDAPGDPHSMPTTGASISVVYQIQNNLPGDTVRADYLTRQLMTFSLGVRLYEAHSGMPQQMTLAQKIQVRNLQR